MEFGIVEILAALALVIFGLRYCLSSNFDFWSKRRVKGPKPNLLFGNFTDVILGKLHASELMKNYYEEYCDEPFIGIFARSLPVLIIRDLDLVKDVLVKHFHVFPDRALVEIIKNDSFTENLLNLEVQRWRPLRRKLSPIFTSGKLKNMFYLIENCADQIEQHVKEITTNDEPIECRELMARYTTDVIGVCVFGLDADALDDSGFREYGKDFMDNNYRNVLRRMSREWFPRVYELLIPFVYNKAMDYFNNSIKETMRYRSGTDFRKNDFIDLLMDIRDESEEPKLDDEILASQAFLFFIAGFETSSTTMSNAVYELALNPHVQDKLRNEITEELKISGKLMYDTIKSMKYLDQVIKETLRKYPPAGFLQRKSVASYKFAGTKVTIPEGIRIEIPILAIHNDPKIYPNPDAFEPERFSEENEKTRHPMAFLPFGDGPRQCIGLRFGEYLMKVGIAALIKNFKFYASDETCIPLRIHPRSFTIMPVSGIYLKIEKI